jgi:type VI secretion system secreted protein Hcp
MPFCGFCKIDGAEGDSKKDGFEKQIELLRFEHSIRQPVSLSASGRGAMTVAQAEHAPFEIVKEQDKATPKIMQFASNGQHIAKVEVTLCRQAGEKPIPYLKYEFEDVVVTYYQPVGDITGDGLPEEMVGFAYGKIKSVYSDSDSTGKTLGQITAEFDRRTGKSA